MTRHRRWVLLTVGVLAACGDGASGAPLQVSRTRSGKTAIIRITPVHGTKVNARLRPELELASGRIERFAGASLTADSAYFTSSPEVRLAAEIPLAGAVVRASVCDSGAAVCRVVTVPL